MVIHSNILNQNLTNEWIAARETPMRGRHPYSPSLAIIFDGFVTYTDLNGTQRRSAFYRKYDFLADRFGPGDDPEREYAD
jgi:hypothetical protein